MMKNTLRHNPRRRGITNRWGVTVHVGDAFKVRGARGNETHGPYTVAKLHTSGAYVKAYGPRVIFDHGGSASIDDLIVTPQTYKKNPSKPLPAHLKGKTIYAVFTVYADGKRVPYSNAADMGTAEHIAREYHKKHRHQTVTVHKV